MSTLFTRFSSVSCSPYFCPLLYCAGLLLFEDVNMTVVCILKYPKKIVVPLSYIDTTTIYVNYTIL
jgi:hypothetical protein